MSAEVFSGIRNGAPASWSAAALCRFLAGWAHPKAAEGCRTPKPRGMSIAMSKFTRVSVCVIVWGIAQSVCSYAADAPPSPPNNQVPENIARLLPRPEDETGFRPLFGENAAVGWAQCGPGSFTLTNGVATSHGGMGLWWHTNRMFTNFVVRGEWRMDNRESDSGVFLRFPNPGQDPWVAVKRGHEMEIGDDPAGKEPAWSTGSLYPFQAPTRVPTKPIGEWNSYEIIAIGQTYVVRINGETVTVWTDSQQRTAAGYIGLQNYQEGKGACHRRLRIKELL